MISSVLKLSRLWREGLGLDAWILLIILLNRTIGSKRMPRAVLQQLQDHLPRIPPLKRRSLERSVTHPTLML